MIDPARFPFQPGTRYRPSGQEVAPVDTLLRIMDQHGVQQGLLVATNSGYGEDLSPVMDALTRGEGRFKAVAVVPLSATPADLARLQARGVVGVAFNTPFHGTAYYAHAGELLRAMTDLGLFLQVQVRGDELLALQPLLDQTQVSLVFDHCGRPDPALGLGQPGFQMLLALGRAGRAVVKLSGFSQFSRQSHPYDDASPYVAALLDAFTPAQTVWVTGPSFARRSESITGHYCCWPRKCCRTTRRGKPCSATRPRGCLAFSDVKSGSNRHPSSPARSAPARPTLR